jgi:uncharacterized protein (TIGR00290 family)
MSDKILVSWSGGKDSVLALYMLRESLDVAALLTIIIEGEDIVGMHGVPRVLIEQQAAALNLPLHIVYLSPQAPNSEYEARMEAALKTYQAQGVQQVAFGDIFLEDIRQYRERNLARIGMRGIYPLWQNDSRALAESFIQLGFQAIVTCVDTQQLDASFAGKTVDEAFLKALPPKVDPCGENGEFHSFVYDAPFFSTPIPVRVGDCHLQNERFVMCQLHMP